MKVRAIFKGDIRFDECAIFELNEKTNRFVMIKDKEFEYEKDIVLNDPNFLVFNVVDDEVSLVKEELDYSYVLGTKVSGTIDRKLGSVHPKHPNIVYEVNYGYVDGVMALDNSEQDIYLLGEENPVDTYEGIVIAVIHRKDDIEDKWIVSKDGSYYTDKEILDTVNFQEQYFQVEIYR